MRIVQLVLILSILLASWLGMQAVHESGHVLGAWATGGRVSRVVLNPLTLSRTDLATNPRPLSVVWAGPVIGVLFPVAMWLVAGAAKMRGAFVLRFFAGFCLVANGAYLSAGSFGGIGDCHLMLANGSPVWLLWAFGGMAVPAGLWLWNGQGRHFGFGPAKGEVDAPVACATAVAGAALLALGFSVGGV